MTRDCTNLADGKYPKAVDNVVEGHLYGTVIMKLSFYTQPETLPKE